MDGELLWTPADDAWATTRLGRFLTGLGGFDDYEAAWRWSVDHLDELWAAVWHQLDVRSTEPYDAVLASAAMPGAVWFPGARLNYAEHALRWPDGDVAVIGRSQSREPTALTFGELRDEVARVAAGLRRLGVRAGDRVAAYLPNIQEAVIGLLAAASLGAVWSSCPPEFGVKAVIDRFGQIEPVVLLAVDGYRYGSRAVDRAGDLVAIRAALPSLRATVLVPYLEPDRAVPDGLVPWDDLRAGSALPEYEPVPFDHPLYVLFSSGTTGLPKAIVHGHGGVLLEHGKAVGLHHDLGPGDRFFWFSTTGWMMWNFLVSGLVVGAAVVLFDGDPGHPDLGRLWDLADETGVSAFGVSAPFLMACRREGIRPTEGRDLGRIRVVGSTGAPLPASGFRWVYEAVGSDLLLSSISGGTDVVTAFLGGTPLVPVRAGELSCRYLGCRVEAFDPAGHPVVGREGELVVTAPMPSMPVSFWADPDGSRYREAYFDVFPGVWRHGDWITIGADGSSTISGRSDATLNRGGVRLGTADFYAVVEDLDDVADSLVVHLEDGDGGLGRLLLFVVLRAGADETSTRGAIVGALRRDLSPRHVPDEIVPVRAIPRTLSGKKLEIPVKRILGGAAAETVAAAGALADPAALDDFVAFAASRG
ncbi:MAG: acetoacetate--CoA ligase [Acidimicrobiia bacterium]